MAAMTETQAIVQMIERQIADAHTEIARLTAARSALVGGESPAAKLPAPGRTVLKPAALRKPTVPRRRANSGRAAVVPAGKLEALLAATPDGLPTAKLAEQAGGKVPQVLTLLRDLERSGKVRRSGQRRGTRWHWITDEDRIRARASELEALARPAV